MKIGCDSGNTVFYAFKFTINNRFLVKVAYLDRYRLIYIHSNGHGSVLSDCEHRLLQKTPGYARESVYAVQYKTPIESMIYEHFEN